MFFFHGAQHRIAPEVAQSVHNSLPIGSFSHDDECVSVGGGTLSESNGRDCKRMSVDSTADCETGSQKRLRFVYPECLLSIFV